MYSSGYYSCLDALCYVDSMDDYTDLRTVQTGIIRHQHHLVIDKSTHGVIVYSNIKHYQTVPITITQLQRPPS